MCSVSVIHDYMHTNIPPDRWSRTLFNDFQEIIRRLDALDSKLDQPECDNDDKAAWMLEVEERLAKIESA